MKQGVTCEKVLLAGRWGKTHALVEAIVKRLCSFMDKSNAGIIDTHDYRLGDLTYPEEILADAKGKNVDFVVIVPHIPLTQGLTGRPLQGGHSEKFQNELTMLIETAGKAALKTAIAAAPIRYSMNF